MVMTVSMANTFSSKVLLTRSWICRVDAHQSIHISTGAFRQGLTSRELCARAWTGSFPSYDSCAAAHARALQAFNLCKLHHQHVRTSTRLRLGSETLGSTRKGSWMLSDVR